MRNTLLDIVIVIYVYKLNDKILKKSTESNIEMKHNNFHNTNKISKNHPNVIQTPIFSRSHKRKKTIETTLKKSSNRNNRAGTHTNAPRINENVCRSRIWCPACAWCNDLMHPPTDLPNAHPLLMSVQLCRRWWWWWPSSFSPRRVDFRLTKYKPEQSFPIRMEL